MRGLIRVSEQVLMRCSEGSTRVTVIACCGDSGFAACPGNLTDSGVL